MQHLINTQVKQTQISGIRKFFNMVAQTDNMISLTLGQPNFATPEHIKTAAQQAIADDYSYYTHNAGFIELRKAASSYLENKYNLSYHPETEVIITAGSSEAIDICFRTILEEGSEVILPAPIYPGYEPVIRMCKAKPVFVDTRQSGFKLTAEALRAALTPQTRCVVIPYPANPTGAVLTKEELEDIAQVLKDKEIFILSDELYSELVFNGHHYSLASFSQLREKTIVINGLSKSHAMTGWRIGLLYAPQYLAAEMLKVHQYNVTCASSISQRAALEALTRGQDDALPMRRAYAERIDYAYSRLVDMGLEINKPSGAFYLFPSIKQFGIPSFDFALRLVKENSLAVIPGDAFSSYGEGYIRLSCAYSTEHIKEGLSRLERFIQNL